MKAMSGPDHGTAPDNPNNIDPWPAHRYADLLAAGWAPDLVDRHRGLLRHAVGPDVHRGIAPGRYAIPTAAREAGACSGPDWARYEVRGFDAEPRLADFRVVFRRGLAGEYAVVPRRQVARAFARLAGSPEMARARYRRLCERCDACLSGSAARERGTCDECDGAARYRRVAHRQAKDQRARERRQEIDGFRRRVLAVLARHAEGMWRSELAEAVGVEARAVGSPAGYRFNLALRELAEAGDVDVEMGMGPTSRGPCRQRRFRLRRDLRVIPGGHTS